MYIQVRCCADAERLEDCTNAQRKCKRLGPDSVPNAIKNWECLAKNRSDEMATSDLYVQKYRLHAWISACSHVHMYRLHGSLGIPTCR